MRYVREGMVCNDCVVANNLLCTDGYQEDGERGICVTCNNHTNVNSTSEYVIPANVQLVRSKDVASMAQELELTTQLFNKQSELFKYACDEIEKLESEVRMLRLGSRWSG